MFIHRVLEQIENICYLFGGIFIVAFLFFMQPGESIYDPPQFGFIL